MRNLNKIIKKLSLAFLVFGMIAFTQTSTAQLINGGFETGDLTGWVGDGARTSTGETFNAWVVNPANNYMGFQQPSQTSLFMSGAETNLGLASGALLAYNNAMFSVSTNFSTLTQDVVLGAGQTVTVWWNFIATDYSPFNDGGMVTMTGPSFSEIHVVAVISNSFGDPEPIITGSYGSTNWHFLTFTAVAAGTYRLGFASFNIDDTILDPWLMNDDAQGGTSAPGEPIVITTAVTAVSPPTAASGGTVSDNGGTPAITVRGICWNTTGSPTTADSFTTDGSGFGAFTSALSGLMTGQTYYVRAYATNSVDTYYGGEVNFTPSGPQPIPISNWAIILGLLLIGTFIVVRYRRTLA